MDNNINKLIKIATLKLIVKTQNKILEYNGKVGQYNELMEYVKKLSKKKIDDNIEPKSNRLVLYSPESSRQVLYSPELIVMDDFITKSVNRKVEQLGDLNSFHIPDFGEYKTSHHDYQEKIENIDKLNKVLLYYIEENRKMDGLIEQNKKTLGNEIENLRSFVSSNKHYIENAGIDPQIVKDFLTNKVFTKETAIVVGGTVLAASFAASLGGLLGLGFLAHKKRDSVSGHHDYDELISEKKYEDLFDKYWDEYEKINTIVDEKINTVVDENSAINKLQLFYDNKLKESNELYAKVDVLQKQVLNYGANNGDQLVNLITNVTNLFSHVKILTNNILLEKKALANVTQKNIDVKSELSLKEYEKIRNKFMVEYKRIKTIESNMPMYDHAIITRIDVIKLQKNTSKFIEEYDGKFRDIYLQVAELYSAFTFRIDQFSNMKRIHEYLDDLIKLTIHVDSEKKIQYFDELHTKSNNIINSINQILETFKAPGLLMNKLKNYKQSVQKTIVEHKQKLTKINEGQHKNRKVDNITNKKIKKKKTIKARKARRKKYQTWAKKNIKKKGR